MPVTLPVTGLGIAGHRTHTRHEMEMRGDDFARFDPAMAPAYGAQRRAPVAADKAHAAVAKRPMLDPGETRERKLAADRMTRDRVRERIMMRFGLLL
jgi:arsenate reductase